MSLSCASLSWDNPEAVRPLATVATAAYIAEGDPATRGEREARAGAAAGMIRAVAESNNPTEELAILALREVDNLDPAYIAALQSLIRQYAPKVEVTGAELAKTTLLAVADGIQDALPPAPQK